jgi:hypothetical protein
MGSVTSSVVPCPLGLATSIVPPSASTRSLIPMSRPRRAAGLARGASDPAVFALAYEGFGNSQVALFAAFGGFAHLTVAAFGGRRDKAVAHLGLALTGSIALVIGNAVSGIEWLAVLITIPVAFGIFFAGVTAPNTASGARAALFGYLLPVATPGRVSMIPDRLAGWWLVSVAATAHPRPARAVSLVAYDH